jgi:serine/threonine protein kinase
MIGQYRTVRLIGRGGMGQVYEVEHTGLEKRFALKLLPGHLARRPGALERFQREARIMARLEHDHILRVDDFGDDDGRYYLRMPLARGVGLAPLGLKGHAVTLQDLADAGGGRVEQALLADLLSQVLDGLTYAHAEGAVHRDIKPANILLESGRGGSPLHVRITDFGLVRMVGEEWLRSQADISVRQSMSLGEMQTVAPSLTQQGSSTRSLLGTYAYMSPEQKRGEQADFASDLYAVGLIVFRFLTGLEEMAFRLPSQVDCALCSAWDRWVMCALEPASAERFPSAAEMRVKLQDVAAAIGSGPEVTAVDERVDDESDCIAGEEPPPDYEDLALEQDGRPIFHARVERKQRKWEAHEREKREHAEAEAKERRAETERSEQEREHAEAEVDRLRAEAARQEQERLERERAEAEETLRRSEQEARERDHRLATACAHNLRQEGEYARALDVLRGFVEKHGADPEDADISKAISELEPLERYRLIDEAARFDRERARTEVEETRRRTLTARYEREQEERQRKLREQEERQLQSREQEERERQADERERRRRRERKTTRHEARQKQSDPEPVPEPKKGCLRSRCCGCLLLLLLLGIVLVATPPALKDVLFDFLRDLRSGATSRSDELTDNALRTLEGHTSNVFALAYSPDGKTLASGSVDNTVKLWNASTGAVIRTLEGHTDSVRALAYSPDGKTLASGSRDKTVKLWNASTGAGGRLCSTAI